MSTTKFYLHECWANRDATHAHLLGVYDTETEALVEKTKRVEADSRYIISGSFYTVGTEPELAGHRIWR